MRVLWLAAGVTAATLVARQAPEPLRVPLELFHLPDGLEITLWASTPMLHNPTNIDIDKDGRVWVAEGVRYRFHHARQPEGDRIVVLEDTDGDGKADSWHTFVQDPELVAPLGIAVIDNKIIVSQPPNLIVYTDVDRNQRFDPAIDTPSMPSRSAPTASGSSIRGIPAACSPIARARRSAFSAPTVPLLSDRSRFHMIRHFGRGNRATTGMCTWVDSLYG